MNEELKRELENVAPELAKLNKQAISAPENYFDTFSDRIIQKIKEEKIIPEKQVIPLFQWKKYLVAALLILTLGLSFYIYKIQTKQASSESNSVEELYLSELDEQTILDYTYGTVKTNTKSELEEYQLYIDEQSIIEEL